jgi:uncharacterized membrane protein
LLALAFDIVSPWAHTQAFGEAVLLGVPVAAAFLAYFAFNSLAAFALLELFDHVDRLASVRRQFASLREAVEKHRTQGLAALFVFTALPVAWTNAPVAAILAYVFDLPGKKSFYAIVAGTALSGALLALVQLGLIRF